MTMHRKGASFAARLAPLLLALCWLVAVLPPGSASATEMTVKIANFTFGPRTLTIPAGTTVTWVNDDDIPHVVAEKDGAFRSKALDTGDTFSHVFAKAGKVEYYCALHPHMTGEIVVTP
jgi:plastocyanin